jgi:hypothetical protein
MFVHKLGLTVTAQKNAEVIEPSDDTLQLDPVNQEDSDRDLGLPYMV